MRQASDPVVEFKQRVAAWAERLRVLPRVVRIQEMRRKWGSCSSGGTITLAADLLEQTREFQDCVIVHELLHLRYDNHGKVFKAVMTVHVPGWRCLMQYSRNGNRRSPLI